MSKPWKKHWGMYLTGVRNVFENLPDTTKEVIESIVEKGCIRIERIVSNGDCSSEEFFYDQNEYEFVLLMQGSATLFFENEGYVKLKRGDYLIIEPHKRHRVESASKDAIWLCVFYR